MIDNARTPQLIGSTAYSSDGDKIGKVGLVFLDDRTDQPAFATINTGFFGTNESFVPLDDASFDGESLTVPFPKDVVKDAPNIELNQGHLDPAEEQRLYQHYSMNYSESGADVDTRQDQRPVAASQGEYDQVSAAPSDDGYDDEPRQAAQEAPDGAGRDPGHATSATNTDETMTRSEERLQVGTTTEEAGRARLRKYVTVEEETVTVPVAKEHAVLETEPITDGDAGGAEGAQISEEEHEVVLHEERPVVEKVTEPVERVRLGTETTTEDQTVTEELRTEHIEAEGDVEDRRS